MPFARHRLLALIGLAAAVEFQLELWLLVPADTPYRGLASLLLLVMAAALVFGRRWPLAGVVCVFGALAALPALSEVYYHDLVLPLGAGFVAGFWLGARAGRAELLVGLVLGGVLGLLATLPYDGDAALTSGLFTLAVSLGAPALVGRLLRGRAALNRALREKASQLERHRMDAAGRAVADERTRIAGELHDVVAHALSAMTVQATGARRLTLTRPDSARDAFGAIETVGREALDELRRLLGVLRKEDTGFSLAPQPSLRHLGSLTRRTTAAGLPVTLRVEGEERDLPAGLDVTAYRVIGDALSAALEHGGAGRAEVRVRYRADTLELEIRDDGPTTARPLIGIHERVALHGGRLTAGARRSGGHAVRATLALDGHPVAREDATDPDCAIRARGESLLRRITGRRVASGEPRDSRPIARRDRGSDPRYSPAVAPRGGASAPHPTPDDGARSPRLSVPSDGACSPRPSAPGAPRDGARSARARLVAWLRCPRHRDMVAAAVFAVVAAIEVVASPDREGPLLANVAVALGYAAPLVWRRRAPLAALITALALALLMASTLTPIVHLFVPFVVVLVCGYTTAVHRDGAEAIGGLVVLVVGLLLVQTTMDARVFADFVFAPLIGSVTWLAGRMVRARTRLTAELHEAAARLAEASEDERRRATVDERRRIAREMHDLVAHSISVMVVQAGGARRILDRDPGRAVEAATRIERTGRDALGEMRALLGMLSDTAEPPALAPQPTLAEVGDLVARARAAGLPAMLDVRGERRPLPAGLDLAAYRIVQEGLTNAMKHAPGAATTVTVSWTPRDLALEIRNVAGDGSGHGGGHGLVGMRERVKLYGGDLEAGPDGGDWRIQARIPLQTRVPA